MSAEPLKKALRPMRRILGEAGDYVRSEAAALRRPELRHIEDALLELNDKERLILALRYYEKLTERDVASALRMKVSEVKRIQENALHGVVRYLARAAERR